VLCGLLTAALNLAGHIGTVPIAGRVPGFVVAAETAGISNSTRPGAWFEISHGFVGGVVLVERGRIRAEWESLG